MAAAPIKVLRPDRQTNLVSAGFFSNDYARNLLPDIKIDCVPLTAWCDNVMGDVKNPNGDRIASQRFRESTRGYDYFNPGYELIPFVPYLLYLRNMSRSDIRLMFLAHAPGCYSMEYVLMRLLAVDGDIVIAPSESGKKTIEFLCQGLSPLSLPHPIKPLPTTGSRRKVSTVATLSRIDPGKLIHRQIEAMQVLKAKGSTLKMEIAGPLGDTQTGGDHRYALLLKEMLVSLRLKRTVRLHDAIAGDDDKSRFLSQAQALVCLSVTIEEAYPKSAVEALGLGIPVIGTRWDGLPEVVGDCGRLIDVVNEKRGGVDVAPEKIAEALMDDLPPADQCREQAQRFSPERIRPLYRYVLGDALGRPKVTHGGFDIDDGKDICAAPDGGALSVTAPLLNLSWYDVFSINLDEITLIRRHWSDPGAGNAQAGLNLRNMLVTGTQRQLERFLSFVPVDRYEKCPQGLSGGDFHRNICNAIKSPATLTSRQICLNRLLVDGQKDLFFEGIEELSKNGQMNSGLTHLTIEGEILKGDYDKAYDMCIADISFAEGDNFRVRQLAKVCRVMKRPEKALPTIRQWLGFYPYAVSSAEIWLDRSVNAAMAGKGYKKEARRSFNVARKLLGSSDVLDKIEKGYLSR